MSALHRTTTDEVIQTLHTIYNSGVPITGGTSSNEPDDGSMGQSTFEKMVEIQDVLDAGLGDARQEKEEVSRAHIQQDSQPTVPDSYGTTDDVYNPYKPFTSREYIHQELAAGRMDPSEVPLPLASTPSGIDWAGRDLVPNINGNGGAGKPTPSSLASSQPTSHERDLQGHLYPTSSDDLPLGPYLDLQDMSDLDYFPQPLVEESDGYDTESNSDLEDRPQPRTPRSSSPSGISITPRSEGLSNGSPAFINLRNRRRIRSMQSSTTSVTTQNGPPSRRKRPDPSSEPMPSNSVFSDRKRRRADIVAGSSRTPITPGITAGSYADRLGKAGAMTRQGVSNLPIASDLSRTQHDLSAWYLMTHQTSNAAMKKGQLGISMMPDNIKQRIGQLIDPSLINLCSPSLLPRWHKLRTRDLVFTSEILPLTFHHEKRQHILNILRTRAPYVPACVSTNLNGPNIQYYVHIKKPSSPSIDHQPSRHISSQMGFNLAWPSGRVPVEVFQEIASYLPRASIEAMRLVNHEFEGKVSNAQFRSVVVGFRPEIYGMMAHDQGPRKIAKADIKGKGKARELMAHEEKDVVQEIHDGMKVFQAWGPHIRKFAMAFEVDDNQLMKPPVKGKFQDFTTFWGPYKWPHPHYRRFEFCAGLEKKADEFRCMSAALSNLAQSQQLALSLDNGLGWLAGPDISDRAQIFRTKPAIFGSSIAQSRAQTAEHESMWRGIVLSLGPEQASNYTIQNGVISKDNTPITRDNQGFYHAYVNYDPSLSHVRSSVIFGEATPTNPGRPLVFQGIDLLNSTATPNTEFSLHNLSLGNKESPFNSASINPNKLTTAQKEWLLETEWAQRAFISSYCMALTDNSHTFSYVHTLNIAKLSSKHLSSLQRNDFWEALSNLNNLTLMVSADFRNIYKNDSGIVESADINPSGAATQLYTLLKTSIARIKGIKTMRLGYSGGGEHQTGIFGRNQLVLPAPLVDYTESGVFWQSHRMVLALPHVEHLTVTNCWIAPPILKTFVARLQKASLRTLMLDSVSFTSHSGVPDSTGLHPMEHGVSNTPQGPARTFNDPHIGNLFNQRPPITSDPVPGQTDEWMFTPTRIGSWADVIDTISPGPTLDLLRYAFQYSMDPPPRRNPGRLERITFDSCGYVRLPLTTLDQSALPAVVNCIPVSLQKRAMDLMPVMMHRNEDSLLGQIAPSMSEDERVMFQTAFPMRIGWGDDERRFDNLEDGQPEGGSGRISGSVERLVFPDRD